MQTFFIISAEMSINVCLVCKPRIPTRISNVQSLTHNCNHHKLITGHPNRPTRRIIKMWWRSGFQKASSKPRKRWVKNNVIMHRIHRQGFSNQELPSDSLLTRIPPTCRNSFGYFTRNSLLGHLECGQWLIWHFVDLPLVYTIESPLKSSNH